MCSKKKTAPGRGPKARKGPGGSRGSGSRGSGSRSGGGSGGWSGDSPSGGRYSRPSGGQPARKSTRPKSHAPLSGVLRADDRGSATVETQEGVFFIPERRTHEAMNGDKVRIRPLPGRHGALPLGAVSGVDERAVTSFVARYCVDGPLRVLVGLDERLLHDFIVEESDDSPERLGAEDGTIVRARITLYPTRRSAGFATIERLIGEEEGETVAIETIIASHDLAVEFPPDTEAQVDGLTLDIAAALREPGRRDIRSRFIVTVDPEDARDFDDALSIEELPGGGWTLGVHIADVSSYVAWESPLDLAARSRGTSVYLADRVIPMLPEKLSCDLCSLRPREDRLAMSVDLTLDAAGRVTGADMYPSVMRSSARLTYAQVDAILGGAVPGEAVPDGSVLEGLAWDSSMPDARTFFGMLDRVRTLREGLRERRGAIEFVSSEAKVLLDEKTRPVGVQVRRSTPATQIVEEAMLAANEAVALRLTVENVPTVYRVHEQPAQDGLAALVPVLTEIGCLDAETKDRLVCGDPFAVQKVLDDVKGKPAEELVSSLLLRAMRRAVYLPTDDGHYGLGADAYCHFTSPIRRYPDLMVHRSLKALLAGGTALSRWRKEVEKALPDICKRSSTTERVAAAAGYESQASKIAEYMGGFIGEVFEGVVVSVQPFGLFVRVRATMAEGLLRVRDLGDGWWDFDEARHELRNEKGGKRYRLGQPLDVRVRSVDPLRGRVEFCLPHPVSGRKPNRDPSIRLDHVPDRDARASAGAAAGAAPGRVSDRASCRASDPGSYRAARGRV